MILDLKNIQWGEFAICKLFEIERSSNKSFSNETYLKGTIDYVGATSRNNGNVGFVNEKFKKHLKDGNCIVFINTGEGSVGKAIYKKNKFIPSNNVTIGRSKFLNEFTGQFIVTINNNQSSKYSYGYIRNEKRIKKDILLLPINKKGEPDYLFMEQFVKQKEKEKINKFQEYIEKKFNALKDFKEVQPLNKKEWREFNLNKIFTHIQRGKRLKKGDHKKGKIPYVSSTALNNGIDGYVGNTENVRVFSNCLTIANSGSVGETFYQPFAVIASDHVTKLENKELNSYTYLFLSTVSKRLSEKYSFNREINDNRIQKEKILLPVNSKKEPDYEYMENYIKKIEFEKLNKYIQRING